MAKSISFQNWVKSVARARGADVAVELINLRKNFPSYKNEKLYATKYPLAHRNYQNYCRRGSQAAA